MIPVFAVDFEAYYDKKVSIKPLGTWGYVFHDEADAYLVSICGSDGTQFVGHPKDAPWEKLHGGIWLAHNYGYDGLVMKRLRREGIIPNTVWPLEEHDTADLAAYLGYPRSLKAAVACLFKTKLSKDTRDNMKGKRWEKMTPEFRAEVIKYAIGDAVWCLKLWQEHGHRWPVKERRLSRLTREQGWRGIRIDTARVERGIELMKRLCYLAEQKIPWIEEGGKALSYPRLVAECVKAGIPAPSSLAMDSEECEAWEEEFGVGSHAGLEALDEWETEHRKRYPWVAAMRTKRRCNALLKKLLTILTRVRADGTMPFGLKYFGAGITGRWSGDAGVNLQNLSRTEQFGDSWWEEEAKYVFPEEYARLKAEGPLEGVDLRACIIPREGYHFIPVDLSQIEPRVLWALAGDWASLELLKTGITPYEVHARRTMGWTTGDLKKTAKTDPAAKQLYQLSKARVLSLGFQAGWVKFITMAALYVDADVCEEIFSAPITENNIRAFEEYLSFCKQPTWNALWKKADEKQRIIYVNSWLIVSGFRRDNPKIIKLWKWLGARLETSIGEDLELELPSGRILSYRAVKVSEDGEITCKTPQFGKMMRGKIYPGALCNNITQGTARDVFAEGLLRLDDWLAGSVLWSVHDEAVTEVPLSVSPDQVVPIMAQAPEWMPRLPVEAEGESVTCYTK